MNNIISVRGGAYSDERESDKYLKIVVADRGDELEITADGQRLPLKGGEVAIIPPLLAHSLNGGSEGTVTILIEQPLLPLRQIEIVGDEMHSGIRSAAEQAMRYFGTEGAARILNALGELIISYIAVQSGRSETSPVVAMLKEDIERGARDADYSVEAFMRNLPLNYDYVRKLFKKETGLTPHEYLTAIRMERAAKIILSGVSNRYSSYTVGQIAEACGYAEPLYFSRVFKKYHGVSPTEYAKNKN